MPAKKKAVQKLPLVESGMKPTPSNALTSALNHSIPIATPDSSSAAPVSTSAATPTPTPKKAVFHLKSLQKVQLMRVPQSLQADTRHVDKDLLEQADAAQREALDPKSVTNAEGYFALHKRCVEAFLAPFLYPSNLIAIILSFFSDSWLPETFSLPLSLFLSCEATGEYCFDTFRDVELIPKSSPLYRGRWWFEGTSVTAIHRGKPVTIIPIEIEWESGDYSTARFFWDPQNSVTSLVDNKEYLGSYPGPVKDRTYWTDWNMCADYCFAPNCSIVLFDGSLMRADCLRPGMAIRTKTNGEFDVVESRVISVLDRVVSMVEIDSDVLITPGHPVFLDNAQWVRPQDQFPVVSRHISAVYNFVLERRGSIIVQDHSGMQWECASLGQFCLGVDDSSDSFFGSERVVRVLKNNPTWPDVHLQGWRK